MRFRSVTIPFGAVVVSSNASPIAISLADIGAEHTRG